jgi:hypothetical protein
VLFWSPIVLSPQVHILNIIRRLRCKLSTTIANREEECCTLEEMDFIGRSPSVMEMESWKFGEAKEAFALGLQSPVNITIN